MREARVVRAAVRISTTEFWAPSCPSAAVEHTAFEGVDELNRLNRPQVRFAALGDAFTARMTRLPLGRCAIEFWGASPHRVERFAAPVATHLLVVAMVVRGPITMELPERTFRVEPGEAFLVDTRCPAVLVAPTGVEMLRAVIELDAVRPPFDPERAPLVDLLPPSPMLESFTAFVAATLRGAVDDLQVDHARIARATIELESALVGEAQQIADDQDGPAGLRSRIRRFINEHAADPGLDAAAVARAVGVSVGHAHTVFNEGTTTLARAIRARRVETAVRLLQTEPTSMLRDVAKRAGFSSTEAMRRALTVELGTTAAELRGRPQR